LFGRTRPRNITAAYLRLLLLLGSLALLALVQLVLDHQVLLLLLWD
jgi:hypothetical protein